MVNRAVELAKLDTDDVTKPTVLKFTFEKRHKIF